MLYQKYVHKIANFACINTKISTSLYRGALGLIVNSRIKSDLLVYGFHPKLL